MSDDSKNEQKVIKETIRDLISALEIRQLQSTELLDIIDVLSQVRTKLDSEKNPPALVNRLVNYIRSVSLKGRIHFLSNEEKLIIKLSLIGQKAGLNGLYMADFSDKTQFYSYLEKMPNRN
ncbi:bacteriocin immunity protein [Dellaglioa algida]|nr:bacteriocin immunity protein [Dellaglioa algida]